MAASKKYTDEVKKILGDVKAIPTAYPGATLVGQAVEQAGGPPQAESYRRALDAAVQNNSFSRAPPREAPNVVGAAVARAVGHEGVGVPTRQMGPTHSGAFTGPIGTLQTVPNTLDAFNRTPGGGGQVKELVSSPSEGAPPPPPPSVEGAVFAPSASAKPTATTLAQTTTVPARTIPLISPERQMQMQEGYLGMQQGSQDIAGAEASAADDIGRAKMHLAEDTRVDDLLDQQRQDERDKAHLAQVQALNKRAEDAYNQKIDPEHYWASRSTPQKVLGIIGLALGGFVQGSTGRENPAATMINRAIDRDIDAQEKNIASAKGKIDFQKGILADQYRVYKDMDAAKSAARASMLQTAMMQLDGQAAQSQSPIIKARAEAEKGRLAHDYAREMAGLEKYVPAHTTTTGPIAGKLDEPRFVQTGPNGEGVYAPTPEEGQKMRDRMAITKDVQNAINEAVQIRENVRAGRMGKIEGARELQRIRDGSLQRFNSLNGGGAMAGHEEGLSRRAIGSIGPSMLIAPGAVNVAHGAVRDLETSVQQRLHGLPSVQSGFRRNPQGQVVHGGGMTGGTYQGGAPPAPMKTFTAFGGK